MSFVGKLITATVIVGGTWAVLRTKDFIAECSAELNAEGRFDEFAKAEGEHLDTKLVTFLREKVAMGDLTWVQALERLKGAAM